MSADRITIATAPSLGEGPDTAFITTPAVTPGRPEWAECTPGFLSQAVHVLLRELALIPQLVTDLQEHRVWELVPGRASNWEEYCLDVLQVPPRFLTAMVNLARQHDASTVPSTAPVDEGVVDVILDPDQPVPTDASAPEARAVFVDRLLVEEWVVLSVAKVWRGAATTVAPQHRERALRTLARIRDVAVVAGIDLGHVAIDEDEGRLVDLSADDDEEDASLAWGLATAEQEIRDLIARDARRSATKSKRARSR